MKCPHCKRFIKPDTLGMTPRQLEVATFIAKYIEDHGVSPSYKEIASAVGLASVSGIARIMQGLRERNIIAMKDNRARSARLVAQ